MRPSRPPRRRVAMALVLALVLFATVAGPALAQQPSNGNGNGNGNGSQNNSGGNSCTGNKHRACEIPEVPIGALVPLVGVCAVAGYVLVDRRRRGAREDRSGAA
jgi:hypothetical protein